MNNPKEELEYLQKHLGEITNPLLIKDVKKGIENLKLILKGVPFCPYCSQEKVYDASYQCIGYWEKLELIKIQGSRGLRIDNLERWEKDGVDIHQLPNSEWCNESYIRYELVCPKCNFTIASKEKPVILVSDDLEKLEDG